MRKQAMGEGKEQWMVYSGWWIAKCRERFPTVPHGCRVTNDLPLPPPGGGEAQREITAFVMPAHNLIPWRAREGTGAGIKEVIENTGFPPTRE